MPNDSFPVLPGWMTATDAAEELGLSRQSINRMISAGVFKTAHTIGKRHPIFVLTDKEVIFIKTKRASKAA